MLQFFSSHTMAEKVEWCLSVLSMSDLVVSAPRSTYFDFFAVHQIRNILGRNHISVASSFFCSCLEIVQALHPYNSTSSL